MVGQLSAQADHGMPHLNLSTSVVNQIASNTHTHPSSHGARPVLESSISNVEERKIDASTVVAGVNFFTI